jgi:chromate transporter
MSIPSPTLTQLFLAFLQIGVSAFGGAMPWARRILVEQRRWLDDKAFTDMLTICQAVPGPNIVNVSVFYGAKSRGVLGAMVSFCGLVGIPLAILLTLNLLYQHYADLPQVKSALLGMAAVATAFMFSMPLKLAQPLLRNGFALALMLAAIALIAVFHWTMPLVLLSCGAVGVLLAWKKYL